MNNYNTKLLEENIIKFWSNNTIYKKIVEKNKNEKPFYFIDGPPFVNSDKLHYGHIHIANIKDSILRYYRMLGFDVKNKIGFDCHGLPIEMVVNKKLNIKTNRDVIENIGIEKYNKECKDLINKYSGSWKRIYDRIGRDIDYQNGYKTMDTNFMESVWWVFKKLWEKDLIYRGYRIMPYSTECGTSLSNFEASQNYKDKMTDSVFVKFKLLDSISNTEKRLMYIIVWTTTPWTLISNLAVCVNSKIEYAELLDQKTNDIYIIAKDSIKNIYNSNKNYKILRIFLGKELVGLKYNPPFNYYENQEFKIVSDSYVNSDNGSGLVHLAPAFGQDDYRICKKNGICNDKNLGNYCPVDENGFFTIKNYKGLHYTKVNEKVLEYLKSNNCLVKKIKIKHSYPFCWRTDKPLIYRAMSSYFVEVTKLKKKLIENNKKVNWIPEYVGQKRFHNWLDQIKDWGISRSRFFGTPIPVWISKDGKEVVCIGSIDELVERAGLKTRPKDLHRESIDKIKIPSRQGKGYLIRVDDIFDCWFESGAVPYAQLHYPFKNKNYFDKKKYLSDFICEGLDQTRGWFYTLSVLGTALFDKPVFKNVICSGLILAENGKKFSKRLQNYSLPEMIIDKYGADSLRLYLISSPATKAEPFKFNETDLFDVSKKLNQLFNSLIFIQEQIKNSKYSNTYVPTTNLDFMDRWVFSLLHDIQTTITKAMKEYQIYKVYPVLQNFIIKLTTKYIKFNKTKLNGLKGLNQQKISISILLKVIELFCRLSAPFIPFLSEYIYQNIRPYIDNSCESIHLTDYPTINIYDKSVLSQMELFHNTLYMVRTLRHKDKYAYSSKVPINKLTICCDKSKVKSFDSVLEEEINTLAITFEPLNDKIIYKAKPNIREINIKYRNLAKKYIQQIKNIDAIKQDNCIEIDGLTYTLKNSEFKVEKNHIIPNIKNIKKRCRSIVKDISIAISAIDTSLLEKYIAEKTELYINIDGNKYKVDEKEFTIITDINIKERSGCIYNSDLKILIIADFSYNSNVQKIHIRNLFKNGIQNLRKKKGMRTHDKVNKIVWNSSDNRFIEMMKVHKNHLEKVLGSEIEQQDIINDQIELSNKGWKDIIKVEILLTC